jgi:hypothetical protein
MSDRSFKIIGTHKSIKSFCDLNKTGSSKHTGKQNLYDKYHTNITNNTNESSNFTNEVKNLAVKTIKKVVKKTQVN